MSDRELFLLMLDQVDDEARHRLRDRYCANDPDRADRLSRLLAAHERAGRFLERPWNEFAPTLMESVSSANHCYVGPGTVLAGRYQLLRQIGRGGMGVVWIAEQNEPVSRRVAIKLIRPDLDSAATFA